MTFPFEYALLRVVPSIERGEAINAGVLLYCRELDFLGARVHLDPQTPRPSGARWTRWSSCVPAGRPRPPGTPARPPPRTADGGSAG